MPRSARVARSLLSLATWDRFWQLSPGDFVPRTADRSQLRPAVVDLREYNGKQVFVRLVGLYEIQIFDSWGSIEVS